MSPCEGKAVGHTARTNYSLHSCRLCRLLVPWLYRPFSIFCNSPLNVTFPEDFFKPQTRSNHDPAVSYLAPISYHHPSFYLLQPHIFPCGLLGLCTSWSLWLKCSSSIFMPKLFTSFMILLSVVFLTKLMLVHTAQQPLPPTSLVFQVCVHVPILHLFSLRLWALWR